MEKNHLHQGVKRPFEGVLQRQLEEAVVGRTPQAYFVRPALHKQYGKNT